MQIKVLSNINSGQYVAGDIAEFDDAEAEQLIKAGAAERLEESASPAPTSAQGQPDGFPVHEPASGAAHATESASQAPATESVPQAPQVPAASEAPAAAAPLEQPSVVSPASSTTSSAPKQPTPEQIAQDVAGL